MNEKDGHGFALLPDRVWDGESDSCTERLAVLIKGGLIAAIGPARDIPKGTKRMALPGCTLMPGLIDAHTHYLESAGIPFLAAGVTTIRDVGNDLDWILDQRKRNAGDPLRGPRILCCGRLLDGNEGLWQHIVKRHGDARSLRASIREYAERGVDQIKLMASLDLKLLSAGVRESHANGKFVLAHLNNVSAELAAKAGLDEIEHFTRCDVAWRQATTQEDDRLIDLFLERGTVMDPTLSTWDRLGRSMEHSFLHDQRRRWVHPELLDIWARFPHRRCEPANRLRFQVVMPNLKRFLLRCHQRGVVVGAGTDTPMINLIPGFSLHDELAQYVDAGLRPVDALRAATATNAAVLGLKDKVGRVKPGMQADLVAIKGNPLAHIDDISTIRLVVRQGRPIEQDELFKAAKRIFAKPMDDPFVRDLRPFVSRELSAYRQKVGD
jgi:imidazolonepropionase-like amidohydrolase